MSLKLSFKELRIYRRVVFVVFVFCMMATFSFFATRGMHETSAASVSGFSAGNIMSDAVMANYNSMSKDDIQRFLTAKNPCNDRDYNKYLRLKSSYPNNSWHFEDGHFICLSEERFGNGNTIGSGQTAAEIIYQAAQDYKINPQVLLVLLQKEQGLITDTYPNKVQYEIAAGFGCPDSASVCDEKYYGLKNQIRAAAALFREVLNGGWSNYPAHKTVYIQYNPNANCGGTHVYIENYATSALYRYTPYQPNSSALNAGYGTGDVCGAYGNRNFYLYFTDWFGDTHISIKGDSVAIPDGVYSFAFKGTNKYLEIADSTARNGSNVQVWEKKEDRPQQWKVTYRDGYYTIADPKTGKVLDLSDSGTENGNNIKVWDHDTNTCAQRWKIYRTPDNYLTFESACMMGSVLDVSDGKNANGANVQIWTTANVNAQKWTLYSEKTLDDGIYTIRSAVAPNKDIDLSNAGNFNGANIQIWSSDKVLAQRWFFQYHADGGYYTITNPATGKRFDLSGAVLSNGNNVQTWSADNATCAQKWRIHKSTKGYTITSMCSVNKALDLSNASTKNGNNIQIWSYDRNALAQVWQITPEPEIADGDYVVQSALNKNKVVDLSNNGNQNGNKIQIWNRDSNAKAQEWTIKRNQKTGLYEIYHTQSGKVFDVDGANMANTTRIQLYQSNSTCAQQWRPIALNGGYYTFFSACSLGKVIDVANGSTDNGSMLWIYNSNNTSAQKWSLTPIKSAVTRSIEFDNEVNSE